LRKDDQVARKDRGQCRKRPPAKTGPHRKDKRQPNHKLKRLGCAAHPFVTILEITAQRFHGARFYSLRSPTQCICVGIDPGLRDAIAAIDDDAQLVLCADLPVISDNRLKWIDSNDLIGLFLECLQGRPARIPLDRSQVMPGQGRQQRVHHGRCDGLDTGSPASASLYP
jgi:hypothetical protein